MILQYSLLLGKLLTLGYGAKLRGKNVPIESRYKLVAAGSPALDLKGMDRMFKLPKEIDVEGKKLSLSDFDTFQVVGNSMYPKGIASGDYLLTKKIDAKEVKHGDFLVLKVDKELYDRTHLYEAVFDYKLRYALMIMQPCTPFDELMNQLKEVHHAEIVLAENQKKLRNKYKAVKNDSPMLLSTTYHDGELSYSFHPLDRILAKGIIKGCRTKDEVRFSKLTAN